MLAAILPGALASLAIGLTAAALWCVVLVRHAETLQPMLAHRPTEEAMEDTDKPKLRVLKSSKQDRDTAGIVSVLEDALVYARAGQFSSVYIVAETVTDEVAVFDQAQSSRTAADSAGKLIAAAVDRLVRHQLRAPFRPMPDPPELPPNT